MKQLCLQPHGMCPVCDHAPAFYDAEGRFFCTRSHWLAWIIADKRHKIDAVSEVR